MIESLVLSDIAVVIAGACLILATIQDIKTRKVYDIFWWVMIGVGIGIQIFDGVSWSRFGLSLIIVPIAFFLGRKVMGMADGLALIGIAVLTPMFSYSDSAITPFTILVNSGILSTIVIGHNVIRNVIGWKTLPDRPGIKKFLMAYHTKKATFAYQYEKKMSNANVHDFAESGWVTPAVPFLLFILIGWLIQVFYGALII